MPSVLCIPKGICFKKYKTTAGRKISVGRVNLYLIDTDIDENDPWNRGISARLYVGDQEQRLRQEIVLGIGGSEVLEHLNIKLSI